MRTAFDEWLYLAICGEEESKENMHLLRKASNQANPEGLVFILTDSYCLTLAAGSTTPEPTKPRFQSNRKSKLLPNRGTRTK